MISRQKTTSRSIAQCIAAILLIPALLAGCSEGGSVSAAQSQLPAVQPTLTLLTLPTPTPSLIPQVVSPSETPGQAVTPTLPTSQQAVDQVAEPVRSEPAGCRSPEEQSKNSSIDDMLAYASRLVPLSKPLKHRRLSNSWNAYTQTNLPPDSGAISFTVGDVEPQYLVQRTLNALQVAGFVTWLRKSPKQGLHILAISLKHTDGMASPWAPYLRAYWADSRSIPDGDATVIRAEKIPPCRWMIDQGYAPEYKASNWEYPIPAAPDYATAASAYLAKTNKEATQVAQRINWLGDDGVEGPTTMCGPLVWSIMNDVGVLPPGYGGWAIGPKAFWLAKPNENGRPWSLFPPELYRVKHYGETMWLFDFRAREPLYPGDFLYTYSIGDGYDHMLVITEKDDTGGIYTVSNIITLVPDRKVTIERVLLLNLNDPSQGIARNRWAKERRNGRTGQGGFDVFRWAWEQKEIDQKAASYTVQPGDTIASIAVLWHTPADQIARYNGITVDSDLTVGQSLQIPPNAGGAS